VESKWSLLAGIKKNMVQVRRGVLPNRPTKLPEPMQESSAGSAQRSQNLGQQMGAPGGGMRSARQNKPVQSITPSASPEDSQEPVQTSRNQAGAAEPEQPMPDQPAQAETSSSPAKQASGDTVPSKDQGGVAAKLRKKQQDALKNVQKGAGKGKKGKGTVSKKVKETIWKKFGPMIIAAAPEIILGLVITVLVVFVIMYAAVEWPKTFKVALWLGTFSTSAMITALNGISKLLLG